MRQKEPYTLILVERATEDCLCEVQDTGPLLIMTTYPVVEIRSLGLLPQSESEKTCGVRFCGPPYVML
jgi:hypothetical protein